MINNDIELLIPFYTPENFNEDKAIYYNSKLKFHDECIYEQQIKINENLFEVKNIYEELDSFVTESGFVNVIKITKSNKKVKLSIDEYLNNVIWFDLNLDFINYIHQNIKSLDFNYRNFGFEILDKLKTELINIPVNKNFQNFLTFLVGVWEDELNTKIDYRK